MTDSDRSREELLAENAELRRRLAELEAKPARPDDRTTVEAHGQGDATSLRVASDTLSRSSELLAKVVESIPIGIWVADPDFVVRIWNSGQEKMTGISRADMVGRNAFEQLPGLREAGLEDLFRRVMQTGKPLTLNGYPLHDPELKRERYYLNIRASSIQGDGGAPGGIVVVIEDITNGRLAEQELQESKDRLELALRSAGIGMWDWYPTTDDFIVSSRLAEIYGFTLNEIAQRGDFFRGRIHPGDRAAVTDALNEHLCGRTTHYEAEYRIRTKTGEYRWVHDRGRVFDRDESGRIARVTGAMLDITEREAAVEERRRLEERIQQAQKLESLGVLAGGIAHDFNNLLVGILGSAELALMDLSPVSPARENIRQIEAAGRRAADLCRQMLAYSGRGRFVIECVDLTTVVSEMAHLLDASISKKAILRYDFGSSLPAVEADVTQMRQIVMNLLTNASEAIGDESGVISLRTGAMECDEAYLAESFLPDSATPGVYAYVEVSDTGCGMDRATQERIFEPFFSTKFTGRGLGLAAVLGIVRGHRGAIRVYSEPGKGTMFRVLFPAVDKPVAEWSESEVDNADEVLTGTVLLVDDEETVRTVGKRMLQAAGFDVLTACDGQDALVVFEDKINEIDCVILDLTMPRMDGEEALRELRRLRPGVPVLLSSGYNEQEIINRFIGRGLAGFIQKPYQPKAFVRKLREVLASEQAR